MCVYVCVCVYAVISVVSSTLTPTSIQNETYKNLDGNVITYHVFFLETRSWICFFLYLLPTIYEESSAKPVWEG